MRHYQIAQETDAQNGVTAERCVKGLLQCSTPSQTGCWITFVTGITQNLHPDLNECKGDQLASAIQSARS